MLPQVVCIHIRHAYLVALLYIQIGLSSFFLWTMVALRFDPRSHVYYPNPPPLYWPSDSSLASIVTPSCWIFPTCRNTRSESCPFCRGSLRRVNSEDLWVLTCDEDVVDAETVSKEDLLRFYLYINSLPKDHPDALFLMYYEYLIWCYFY